MNFPTQTNQLNDEAMKKISFKENLQRKIELEKLAFRVVASCGTDQAVHRVDKESMRQLLEMSPYHHQQERDLDLYVKENGEEHETILVLDNELPIFRSTVKDVVTRRSPRTLEMWNFKTIRRILVDSDIKVSKGAESVEAVLRDAVGQLDLTYTDADIKNLAREGMAWLAGKEAGEVEEIITLFAALLGYKKPPKYLKLDRMVCYGLSVPGRNGEIVFGPMVLYRPASNTLLWIEGLFSRTDEKQLDLLNSVVSGRKPAPLTGDEVFEKLQAKVLEHPIRTVPF